MQKTFARLSPRSVSDERGELEDERSWRCFPRSPTPAAAARRAHRRRLARCACRQCVSVRARSPAPNVGPREGLSGDGDEAVEVEAPERGTSTAKISHHSRHSPPAAHTARRAESTRTPVARERESREFVDPPHRLTVHAGRFIFISILSILFFINLNLFFLKQKKRKRREIILAANNVMRTRDDREAGKKYFIDLV